MKIRVLATALIALSSVFLPAETLFVTVRQYLHSVDSAMALTVEDYDQGAASAETEARKVLLSTVKEFPLPHVVGGYNVVDSFGQAVVEGRIILGMDIAGPPGTPVHAAGDGVIVETGSDDYFGRYLVIEHANAVRTIYGHLAAFAGKKRGSVVKASDVIGYLGMTGFLTEPSLYFAVLRGDMYVNPTLALDRFALLN